MDWFRPSNRSLSCSNKVSSTDVPVSYSRNTQVYIKYQGIKQGKSGRWYAQITFGKSKRHLGTFNTAEEAVDAFARAREERDSMKRKQKLDHKEAPKSKTKCKGMKSKSHFENASAEKATDGLCPSSSFFNSTNNVPRAHTQVSDSTTTLVKKKKNKYPGVRQKSSGRWSAEIWFGMSRRYYLGTFKTAEEAANAFARAKMERDLMKRNPKLNQEEAQKSLEKGKALSSKPVIESAASGVGIDEDHIETEKACCLAGGELCSLVLPTKRELELQYPCDVKKKSSEFESPYLFYEAKNSGAIAEEDNQQSKGSYTTTSNSIAADNQLIPENANEENLEMGIVNSYGQLVGEYSRLDDQLWICRREEDDDDDDMY